MLDSNERIARLQLARSNGIGPVTFRRLIERYGTAARAAAQVPELSKRGGRAKPLELCPRAQVEDEIAKITALGASLVIYGDDDYPAHLAAIEDAPIVLTVRGQASLLKKAGVGVVGSRNASLQGRRFAESVSADLGRAGLIVSSGLARGIDTAAHQGSVASGTIGVIACGLDVVFPPEKRDLQAQIADEGLLVTEHPPGTQPLARHFPARNRIIAGLALGTVVVEAAPKSGSLITARLAGEAGREVMAVPGSPLDPRAQGCNQLIRDGATLIQNAADVLEAVGQIDPRMVRQGSFDFAGEPVSSDVSAGERDAVIALLSHAPAPVDDLIRLSGFSPAVVQTVLLELELAERLDRLAGGRVSLR